MITDEKVEAIATAITDADVSYEMSLVRLVDGIHTYSLKIDSEILKFTDDENGEATDQLYEHVRSVRRRKQAEAVISALSVSPDAAQTYQNRVAAAHGPLFDGDPTDVAERLARHAEENNELCQALGMTREEAHQLVDYTWDRPIGEPKPEIGSTLLTLASLCVVAGHDMMECAEADLEKLMRPETIARIRAKRATRHGRGPLPGLSPPSLDKREASNAE